MTPEQKKAAIRLAWKTGNLQYKLQPIQKKVYKAIKASKELIYVVNCTRRGRKTTTAAIIAMELAIQNKNYQIHFGAPYQNALKDFLIPIINQILQDCPDDLRPTLNKNEGKLYFSSGSTIKFCGSNNGQFENLRGNKSDLFILDEAAQIDQLRTVIYDVAMPQLLSSENPFKKIILASTPPKTPDHPYKKYAEEAKVRGAYSSYTIYDCWYPKEDIDKFARESGGADSTTFRREYLAEFIVDSSLHIIPEWDTKKYVQEIEKNDYFKFYTILEGLDIGYRDFTAWIMGYYDWNNTRTIIEYELALKENDLTTEKLADYIKTIEKEYKQLNNTRIRRVSDNNNLNIISDLSKTHSLPFAPVQKRSGKSDQGAKEWMVNQTREYIQAGNLLIHPRCKMLIASLEFGLWKPGYSEFDRSEELGHYDFLDSLIYLISYLVPLIRNINPVPPLYGLNVSTTMFPENKIPTQHPNPQDEIVKKIFLR